MIVQSPRTLVPPVAALSDNRVRLFLTSAALLFVELFLIRWIPANVIYVGFFANVILIGSFLGIGVGIILGRRAPSPTLAPFPLLFFLVIKLVTVARLNVTMGSPNDIIIGGSGGSADLQANVLILVLIFGLTTAVMAALALPLGGLLRSMPPLRAYAIDITGSLTGIAVFTLMSFLGIGPVGWTIVVALLVVLLGLARGITAWSAVSVAALIGCLFTTVSSTDLWSPYQRLTVQDEAGFEVVLANGIPHQGFPIADVPLGLYFGQIDDWFPDHAFDDVLIIGAGTGNDTAMSVRRGDRRIDAVEIDPVILGLGVERNYMRPYQDPRVNRTVDDGRAFLRKTDRKYDLAILAQTDSLTLFSTTGNVRLESFLFTREAFAAVRDRLKPGGIMVLYNFYWQDWAVDRLGWMLQDTFGRPTIISRYGTGSLHAAALVNGPGLDGVLGVPPGAEVMSLAPPDAVPTDAWPFPYLRQPGISPPFIAAIVLILAFATLLVIGSARWSGMSVRRFSPHFFLLGAAFLLLETKSLVSFGLLFGNTWTVNALVFFAVLLSVLASIGLASILPRHHPAPWYIALFVSLALGLLIPPSAVLIEPPILRYAAAMLLAFSPVFFANLCFTYSFRDSASADMSFASNLLGAVLGGTLEYIALVTGYQQLAWLVVLLYLAAYVAVRWLPRLADRELAMAGPTAPPRDGRLVDADT